jgi:5'-phosphate synthase pdxT subunit
MENGTAEVDASSDAPITIGVLALQGAFREHIAHLCKLPGVTAVEVRKKEDLDGVDGLVIPGGTCTLASIRAAHMSLIVRLCYPLL